MEMFTQKEGEKSVEDEHEKEVKNKDYFLRKGLCVLQSLITNLAQKFNDYKEWGLASLTPTPFSQKGSSVS